MLTVRKDNETVNFITIKKCWKAIHIVVWSTFFSIYTTADVIRLHNERVLENLRLGDMVEFERSMYSHWGIYAGNDLSVQHIYTGRT